MARSVLVLVVAAYAAVATAYFEAARRGTRPPSWARWWGPITVAGHLLGLWLLARAQGRSPFATAGQALSFLAFAMGAVYVLLEWTTRVSAHGAGFHAIAGLLSAVAVPGMIEGGTSNAPPHGPLIAWQTGLGLLASAAVLAAGVLALGYLRAYRRMKDRTLNAGPDGPSLAGFQRLLRGASVAGAVGLLVPVGIGVHQTQAAEAPGGLLWLTLSMGVVCAVMGIAAWIWIWRPARGARAAWLNLCGVVLLVAGVAVVHPLVLRGGL